MSADLVTDKFLPFVEDKNSKNPRSFLLECKPVGVAFKEHGLQ